MAAAALHSTPAADKAAKRIELGNALASAVVGHPLQLQCHKTGWDLVDRTTGHPLVEIDGQLHLVNPDTGEAGPALAVARTGRYAALLLRAALPQNHLVGIMDAGDKGSFMGAAAAWKSSLRLDPNWAEAMRRRSRGIARQAMVRMLKELPANEAAMRRYPMRNGAMNPRRLTLKLLTLTMPHWPGTSTLPMINLFNLAFRALTKTALYQQCVWGGIKGIEDALDWQGPHVHGHFLILSRYVDRGAWRMAWWQALNTAVKAQGGPGLEHMPGGLPFLDVRMVRRKDKAADGENVSLDEALDEVTKYVTKTSDLVTPDAQGRTVSGETLLELCDIERWPRMFELLGKARKPRPQGGGTRLDTACISAAGGVLDLLDSFWSEAQEPEEGDRLESMGLKNGSARGPRQALAWQWNHGKGGWEAKERIRPPSWRSLMTQLPLSEWLHLMMGRAERGFRFRLSWLKEHNPTLFLADMTGKIVAKQAPDLEPA
jgi:hypothetical protein